MTTEHNPVHHTQKIKVLFRQLIGHLREDIGKITDSKAQAMFETSAEVLTGLVKAFDDYEERAEPAWRAGPRKASGTRRKPPGRANNLG